MESTTATPTSPSRHEQRYSIEKFIQSTVQRDRGQGVFELESPRTLELNLNNNYAWTKMGSMVAYRGDVKFVRENMMEHGIGKLLKKAVTGEGTSLTKAEGTGQVYLADHGKKVFILDLKGEKLVVNGNDILAFEGDGKIDWDIKMVKKAGAMLAGGLVNVHLTGHGMLAITTYYEPLTLMVKPGEPVFTDPNATVAWSGSLEPELKLDISLKSFLGRASGESVQLKFEGEGFVVVQPYEETYYDVSASS